MKHENYILIFVLLICTTNCYNYQPAPYGIEFNPMRAEVGLRLIDSTFYKAQIPEDYDNWPIKRKRKQKIVSHIMDLRSSAYIYKYNFINRESGKLIFEEDVYASGRKKIAVSEATIYELLIYRYIFEDYEGEHYNTKPYYYNYLDSTYDSLYGGYTNLNVELTKNTWQYIHVFPIVAKNIFSTNPDIILYVQNMEYLTKARADSIRKSWNLNNVD